MKFITRIHPNVLFSNQSNFVDLILRIENPSKNSYWLEADIEVPTEISLSNHSELTKGKLRVGIIGKDEFVEKSVKIYANRYSGPKIYPIKLILYSYDQNGIIHQRLEKTSNVRCEKKRDESL